MTERDWDRGGVPVSRRVRKPGPPHPSPSPSPAPATRRKGSIQVHRRKKSLRPIQILTRCNSESTLWRAGAAGGGDFGQRDLTPPEVEVEGGVLYRPQTCADIFSGYNKEAKVVVNVTVEGSPGPVRAMVKLGSSVEETIKLVIDKYGEEGRSPRLDKDATSTFELHHSHFSLQSLNKSDAIGDAGSRSFYLRKSGSGCSSNASLIPDTDLSENPVSHPPAGSPLVCLGRFIFKKFSKFIRRMCNIWKILGCINCNG
ncbi:hypothetical protein ACH5RR_041451 [Cinchona calisaya]|uniref:DUF7054 domain-containing protein n=1 Tax=Cinchona calisaya TaxID=153742 RepID=A0ABD2XTR1_9GENT